MNMPFGKRLLAAIDEALAETDDRMPKRCPRCGEVCTYDGWDHCHPNGRGIGSCEVPAGFGVDDPVPGEDEPNPPDAWPDDEDEEPADVRRD